MYNTISKWNIFASFKDTKKTGNTEDRSSGNTKEARNKEKVCEAPPIEFTIGDIVWAQARGLPSWPGKIVDERDVGHGKAPADTGKVNTNSPGPWNDSFSIWQYEVYIPRYVSMLLFCFLFYQWSYVVLLVLHIEMGDVVWRS